MIAASPPPSTRACQSAPLRRRRTQHPNVFFQDSNFETVQMAATPASSVTPRLTSIAAPSTAAMEITVVALTGDLSSNCSRNQAKKHQWPHRETPQ